MMDEEEKNDFMESPIENKVKMIFGLVLVSAILFLVFSVIFSAMSVGETYTETFSVDDASVDFVCNLEHTPESSTVSVSQYTGSVWEDVSNADVTVSGSVVTVDDGALYG